MAQIANLTNNPVDAHYYTTIAHSYINDWQGMGCRIPSDGES
jgi:hypothetical protein